MIVLMQSSECVLEATVGPNRTVPPTSLEVLESFIHLPVVAMQQVHLPDLARLAVPPGTTTMHGVEQIGAEIRSVRPGGAPTVR